MKLYFFMRMCYINYKYKNKKKYKDNEIIKYNRHFINKMHIKK